jgi:hypothetical protein
MRCTQDSPANVMDCTSPTLQRRCRLHPAITALITLGLAAGFALPGSAAEAAGQTAHSTDAHKRWDSGDAIADHPLKAFEAQFGDPTTFIHGAFMSLNLAYPPD